MFLFKKLIISTQDLHINLNLSQSILLQNLLLKFVKQIKLFQLKILLVIVTKFLIQDLLKKKKFSSNLKKISRSVMLIDELSEDSQPLPELIDQQINTVPQNIHDLPLFCFIEDPCLTIQTLVKTIDLKSYIQSFYQNCILSDSHDEFSYKSIFTKATSPGYLNVYDEKKNFNYLVEQLKEQFIARQVELYQSLSENAESFFELALKKSTQNNCNYETLFKDFRIITELQDLFFDDQIKVYKNLFKDRFDMKEVVMKLIEINRSISKNAFQYFIKVCADLIKSEMTKKQENQSYDFVTSIENFMQTYDIFASFLRVILLGQLNNSIFIKIYDQESIHSLYMLYAIGVHQNIALISDLTSKTIQPREVPRDVLESLCRELETIVPVLKKHIAIQENLKLHFLPQIEKQIKLRAQIVQELENNFNCDKPSSDYEILNKNLILIEKLIGADQTNLLRLLHLELQFESQKFNETLGTFEQIVDHEERTGMLFDMLCEDLVPEK
eukprot:403365535